MGANRCQCMAVFESAMDGSARQRRQNISGQVSLFDIGQAGEDVQIRDEFPPLREFAYRELLVQEKEMTGVYISGHPLDEYTKELDALSFSSRSLAEMEDMPDKGISMDGTRVSMGGIITECHSKATRKGSLMGFVTIEDLTGQVEGLLFPKVWERYGRMLKEDMAVLLSGRISVREEESPKLLVDAVEPLSAAGKRMPEAKPENAPRKADDRPDAVAAKEAGEKLYLRMPREKLPECEKVLRACPGGVPVYVNLPQEGITLLLPRECWVESGDETIGRLSGLLPLADMKTVRKG
ncbi:MAG: hypothetical protein CW338_06625 [Clostridiales bacterium]|nr:hypothetical protein [Clostridiales bacterium]